MWENLPEMTMGFTIFFSTFVELTRDNENIYQDALMMFHPLKFERKHALLKKLKHISVTLAPKVLAIMKV